MAKIKIHYLQHVPSEGPGCIDFWAQAKGHSLTGTKFYQNDTLPNIDTIDWLIILGGPMSANDDDRYSWMKSEKSFIEQAIKKNKVVIGICLGSQLLANVLGSKVYKHQEPEIGWFPVSLTESALNNELFTFMPPQFEAFHWHEETFDLPKNAQLLMSSVCCTNQAYQVGKKLFGFQFHPEITSGIINEMLQDFDKENQTTGFVQSANDIMEKSVHIADTHSRMRQWLNNLAEKT